MQVRRVGSLSGFTLLVVYGLVETASWKFVRPDLKLQHAHLRKTATVSEETRTLIKLLVFFTSVRGFFLLTANLVLPCT